MNIWLPGAKNLCKLKYMVAEMGSNHAKLKGKEYAMTWWIWLLCGIILYYFGWKVLTSGK